MKALIRDNEIIPEPWDQWTQKHLDWLTTPRPDGDGYHIIDGYDPVEHGELSAEELNRLFCNSC